ncbi:hypothetical protein ACFC09_15410 [Streptomyces sp. NPDC056161]|uniref:hypothetical protein n=1 Tax=Streptomyces sp. NPDC056161 TaxID=3345732 RepID=UPI0035DC843F
MTAVTTAQTPGDVIRPGVKIRKDGHMKWTVERDGHMGVIFDEEGMKRGRWAAWSPFARTPHGMAAFTSDAEEAVDAILATLPVRVSTLAEASGHTPADIVDEAAELAEEWAAQGPRAVFRTAAVTYEAEISGPAALVVMEALAARAAAPSAPTPGDVVRPGVTIRKSDGYASWAWSVERDGHAGALFDAEASGDGTERGRWVAWSPFAETWRNLVASTDDAEEAVDAILATLPALASTVAEVAGVATGDVLEEAANLSAEWKGQGRRVFLPKVLDGDAELTGPAVLVILETLAARAAEAPAEEAAPTPGEPEWRTLKGMEAPFFLYGTERDGHWFPSGDRKQVTGRPLRITRVWTDRGLRYAEDETGRELSLYGPAGKFWAAPVA